MDVITVADMTAEEVAKFFRISLADAQFMKEIETGEVEIEKVEMVDGEERITEIVN